MYKAALLLRVEITYRGAKLVKISNVNFENLTWDDTDFLPEVYLSRYEEFALSEGDIVLALTRPIIKSLNNVKVARVAASDVPCLLNQRVGRFVIRDRDRIDPSYLIHLCYSQFFKKAIIRFSSESLQPNVSPKQIEELHVPVPPIERQRQFASVAAKVTRLKRLAEVGSLNAENLFKSLQLRAFKGELFINGRSLVNNESANVWQQTSHL